MARNRLKTNIRDDELYKIDAKPIMIKLRQSKNSVVSKMKCVHRGDECESQPTHNDKHQA